MLLLLALVFSVITVLYAYFPVTKTLVPYVLSRFMCVVEEQVSDQLSSVARRVRLLATP